MNVSTLYRIFTSAENRVAGGEGVVGIYGSLTGSSMHRIFSTLKVKCGFTNSSTFLDVGAGLGRPLLHAMYLENVHAVQGIEIDHVKCIKADAFAERVGRILQERSFIPDSFQVPEIRCESIEDVETLEPATHVYSFWEGFPHDSRDVFSELCGKSKTLCSITIVQRATRHPEALLSDAFFLVESFPVTMSGSYAQFVAYVFLKIS